MSNAQPSPYSDTTTSQRPRTFGLMPDDMCRLTDIDREEKLLLDAAALVSMWVGDVDVLEKEGSLLVMEAARALASGQGLADFSKMLREFAEHRSSTHRAARVRAMAEAAAQSEAPPVAPSPEPPQRTPQKLSGTLGGTRFTCSSYSVHNDGNLIRLDDVAGLREVIGSVGTCWLDIPHGLYLVRPVVWGGPAERMTVNLFAHEAHPRESEPHVPGVADLGLPFGSRVYGPTASPAQPTASASPAMDRVESPAPAGPIYGPLRPYLEACVENYTAAGQHEEADKARAALGVVEHIESPGGARVDDRHHDGMAIKAQAPSDAAQLEELAEAAEEPAFALRIGPFALDLFVTRT